VIVRSVMVVVPRVEVPLTASEVIVVVARLAVVETTRFETERVPVAETEARIVPEALRHSVRLADWRLAPWRMEAMLVEVDD